MGETNSELAERLAVLATKLDGNIELQKELIQNIRLLVAKHELALYNGYKDGLVMKVDRLEKEAETRKWLLRTSLASLIAVIGKVAWDVFQHFK